MEAVSEQRLALVHPLLAAKVRSAAAALETKGIYFRVAQGLRTYAEQDALYAQGRTVPGKIVTNAPGGYSNHNFGCAVDCYPFLLGESGNLNWEPKSQQFSLMVDALVAEGLLWGGNWHSLPDYPHFQLANVPVNPTNTDRAAFLAGGLQRVWSLYTVSIAE